MFSEGNSGYGDIEIEAGGPLGNDLFDNKHWPLSEANQMIGDGNNKSVQDT